VFKPDPKRQNILADTFYRYFVLQFFNADFNLTVCERARNIRCARNVRIKRNGVMQVTASQVYGNDETTKRELRLFSHGKLKTEILNDEHYPPSLSFAKRAAIRFSSMQSGSKSSWVRTIERFVVGL